MIHILILSRTLVREADKIIEIQKKGKFRQFIQGTTIKDEIAAVSDSITELLEELHVNTFH